RGFSSSLVRMKVKIRQWSGVASWSWVANDENCGICRMPFNGCCPDCEYLSRDIVRLYTASLLEHICHLTLKSKYTSGSKQLG
ncbi:hypothetical protein XENOCAPTIV_023196, partial [Xenoophorus captivus]